MSSSYWLIRILGPLLMTVSIYHLLRLDPAHKAFYVALSQNLSGLLFWLCFRVLGFSSLRTGIVLGALGFVFLFCVGVARWRAGLDSFGGVFYPWIGVALAWILCYLMWRRSRISEEPPNR